jgi:translation initiation factor 2 subunit 1
VLRVESTGNIDLSKRRVTSEEATAAETKYLNAKTVQSLMRHVATACEMDIEDVCKAISWPLYRSFNTAHEALRRLASGAADDVMAVISPNITPEMETALMEVVMKRLTPEPLKIRADVEVSCFGFTGVEAVRAALIKGRDASVTDAPLSIRLVAAPQYMITTSTFSKDLGLKTVEDCVSLIKEEIEKQGGKFVLKYKTQVVGNDDTIINETEEDEESGSEEESDVSDE